MLALFKDSNSHTHVYTGIGKANKNKQHCEVREWKNGKRVHSLVIAPLNYRILFGWYLYLRWMDICVVTAWGVLKPTCS